VAEWASLHFTVARVSWCRASDQPFGILHLLVVDHSQCVDEYMSHALCHMWSRKACRSTKESIDPLLRLCPGGLTLCQVVLIVLSLLAVAANPFVGEEDIDLLPYASSSIRHSSMVAFRLCAFSNERKTLILLRSPLEQRGASTGQLYMQLAQPAPGSFIAGVPFLLLKHALALVMRSKCLHQTQHTCSTPCQSQTHIQRH
jgi:hypothetical protein